ncbi:T9SS type A sorting domain-containing protein [Parabacteroides sp. ZJ-118]|uniref:T9SS type A sorting domain-containing protein n=1 Tax=Parabacteroides sp. ZJ-118 TaxID=2709398 RepID=UPI0013EAC80B|nr:T9SS type A sorting domain-containing protein [Parabacteroides sp. ZJ-118]
MKKSFLFIAIACVLSVLSQAQVYNFPVRPGTEAWGNLVTEEDRFSAMQIPEDQLKSMSTQDLIVTCMNYPAWIYFTAFNNPQDGLDINIRNFNGLQELMNRADAPAELLSVYKQMDAAGMAPKSKAINQTSWSLKRSYFELLLAQDAIINKMSETDRMDLLGEARNRLYQKMEDPVEYSTSDYQSSLILMNKILGHPTVKSNQALVRDPIDQLIVNGSIQPFEITIDAVYSNTTIYTPKGTAVSALQLTGGELSSSEKNKLKNEWLSYYNNRIVFKGEATYAYNCHAYAWYCSEGHSYVWISSPGDDAFWNDGSFVQTTNTSGKDCKVSFPNDDHSAVTSSRSGYLISKWGRAPLFEHSINDCPYNSSGLRYYTYPDPTYNTVPPKPSVETFRKDNDQSFTAAVSCDSRYNVDQYEWKSDYPSDWSVVAQNASKSSVKVYRSSTPRSCYLSARAHNSYGWGEWAIVGWLYASSTYSLSVLQNPASSTLQVQIVPNTEMQSSPGGELAVDLTVQKPVLNMNPTYSVGLYSNTGTCVYQNMVKGNGSINLNINVSSLSNGIYILHVKTANESAQTLNVVVKH